VGAQRVGQPIASAQVVVDDRTVRADRFGHEAVTLVVLRQLGEDLFEGVNEVQLALIAHLGQRVHNPLPVEDPDHADDGEGSSLQVQPPDPGPVLCGAQTVGEPQRTVVGQAAVVDAGPGPGRVHRRQPVVGQDG
jgi:hypothetical protein